MCFLTHNNSINNVSYKPRYLRRYSSLCYRKAATPSNGRGSNRKGQQVSYVIYTIRMARINDWPNVYQSEQSLVSVPLYLLLAPDLKSISPFSNSHAPQDQHHESYIRSNNKNSQNTIWITDDSLSAMLVSEWRKGSNPRALRGNQIGCEMHLAHTW